jgi:signal transduction histidine kinase
LEQGDHRNPTDLSVVGITGTLHEARSLTLNHQQSMISFEFSALHFYHHDRNSYAWKLEGSDREWIYGQANQSVATYTNLNPGHYRLLAKAANPDGVWSESTSLLEIDVLPPFWRTWWWYLCWTISALVILGIIYRHRVSTTRAARLHLEDQVKNRTQEVLEQKIVAEHQRELAEKARHDISILSEIGRQITASLDPQSIQQTLYQYVKQLVKANTFGIGIVDWDSRIIAFNFLIQNEKLAKPYQRSLDANEQPSVQCVNNAQELNIGEFTHDGRTFDKYIAETTGETKAKMQDGSDPEVSRSGLYVPMTLNKKVIGVIALLSDQPHAFDQNAVVILRTLSAYAAVALENAESYRRLQLTQDKLVEQEKLAALGSLVAGVAHELNTPIGNSVLTASTMHNMNEEFLALVQSGQLRRSNLETFCNNSTNSVNLIVRNLDNAARLITSFKQIAVDQTSDKRRLFDLKTVCNEVALTLSNRLKREGHELRIDVEDGLQMDSYPGSFGQVLSNLVINAIVHGLSEKNHGIISLQAKAIENDQVKIIFHDDGRGIDAAHINHVFEPFFTTRLGQGGSGLGLHICYNIIYSVLGGSIELRSSPGEGASFTITLPLVAPLQKEKTPQSI